jgi:hypothetical protein
MLLGCKVQLLLSQHGQCLHLPHNLPHVLHGVHHVAGTGLSFGADHRRAFRDAAQRLAEVTSPADKGCFEGVLVNVVRLVGGGEHFRLVDEIDAELLQNLRLGKVADAGLGHHRDRDRFDDPLDELRIGHAGNAAFGADHRRNTLQRHDRHSTGLLGNLRLLDVHHVHDDAAL